MNPQEAGQRNLALVSGFGDEGLRRPLMVLQAYVDASGKGDPHHLVLAGYIATAETWIDFSNAWKAKLDEAKLEYFKMNKWAGSPEIAAWFYRTLEEHDIKAALSCTILTDELIRVHRSIRFPGWIRDSERLENPYYFAFKAIIDGLAQLQPQLGLADEPVDFVFDNDTEKALTIDAYELIKENSAPEFAVRMPEFPIYRDDKNVRPLQAADLLAWWILKWEREGSAVWCRDVPFPWEKKRNIRGLHMRFEEFDFLVEHSKALAKFARNDAELEYALSLMPPDGALGWRDLPKGTLKA